MRNTLKRIINGIVLYSMMVILTVPACIYGSEGSSGDGGEGTTAGQRITLQNPLKVKTISELLQLILDIVTIFAVPIIVFFIIYSGFLYVTARGDTTKITKARDALLWSVIGGVIILGANVLLIIIQNTVKSLQ